MESIALSTPERKVVVGVNTHKHLHVAVALDELGARLGELTVGADSIGYAALASWSEQLGRPCAFGIEGTGSYGAGLSSFLRRRGYRIVEVDRGDRRGRGSNGKSDTLDAEAAARAVLAGSAGAIPKSADGVCEMVRQVKIARDTAVKARTQALITLKCIVVNAPPELREQLEPLADKALLNRCAGFRRGPIDSTTASAKHTLRALARRWLELANEIAIPASSGKTNRHRLSRGGHRQANSALYRVVIVRMRFHQPTIDYVSRRSNEGRSKREIIRCLKRFLAREIYRHVMTDRAALTTST